MYYTYKGSDDALWVAIPELAFRSVQGWLAHKALSGWAQQRSGNTIQM
jgi:hypothetical protein